MITNFSALMYIAYIKTYILQESCIQWPNIFSKRNKDSIFIYTLNEKPGREVINLVNYDCS
jgi:hypothetical protein